MTDTEKEFQPEDFNLAEVDEATLLKLAEEADLEQFILSLADTLDTLDFEMKTIMAKEEWLAGKRKTKAGQVEKVRSFIALLMLKHNKQKVKNGLYTVSLKDVPPKLEVTDESRIPAEYWKKQDPRLDKDALFKDIKDHGVVVEGARLSNGGKTIQFRR